MCFKQQKFFRHSTKALVTETQNEEYSRTLSGVPAPHAIGGFS